MADLKNKLRSTWIKSMETIGTTASGIASNARFKVEEMNQLNRRREVLNEIAAAVLELHRDGEVFPEAVESLLKEIDGIDETVRQMREAYIMSVTPVGVKEEPELIEDMPIIGIEDDSASKPDDNATLE